MAIKDLHKNKQKQGIWLPCKDENNRKCSECGTICMISEYPHGRAAFCPICGTPMVDKNLDEDSCIETNG